MSAEDSRREVTPDICIEMPLRPWLFPGLYVVQGVPGKPSRKVVSWSLKAKWGFQRSKSPGKTLELSLVSVQRTL